jgi:hypothetical protein
MSLNNAQLESLESRRLMSVSATTFFGPPTVGTTWAYDATLNGGAKSRHSIKVAGTAKVAGENTLRLMTSQKIGSTTVTGSAYDTVDNVKGVVQYAHNDRDDDLLAARRLVPAEVGRGQDV